MLLDESIVRTKGRIFANTDPASARSCGLGVLGSLPRNFGTKRVTPAGVSPDHSALRETSTLRQAWQDWGAVSCRGADTRRYEFLAGGTVPPERGHRSRRIPSTCALGASRWYRNARRGPLPPYALAGSAFHSLGSGRPQPSVGGISDRNDAINPGTNHSC